MPTDESDVTTTRANVDNRRKLLLFNAPMYVVPYCKLLKLFHSSHITGFVTTYPLLVEKAV